VIPQSRLTKTKLVFIWVMGPCILFTFAIIFQTNSYQYWGDKYHSVLSSQYLFSQFHNSSFVRPLWREDVLSGNLWLVNLPTVPFMLDNVAARVFHLSPFGIDLIGNLAGYAVTTVGMYLYLLRALLVSSESALAGSLLFAGSGYISAVWTGWPHAYVITGLLPLLLATAHKLNASVESCNPRRILLSWIWLSFIFYITVAVDSFRTFPIILSIVSAYTLAIFGLGRCAALVMMAMITGVVLYAPWLWLLWDAVRISQRISPDFVHVAAFGIGHLAGESMVLLRRMASGFNVYGVSVPTVFLVLLALSHHDELRNESRVVKRILGFAGVAFVVCFGMDAFSSQINAFKKDIPYLNGYDVVRFEFFASFFSVTIIAWILDRVLIGASRIPQLRSRPAAVAITATGILFAVQAFHLFERLNQLPAKIYPQDMVLYTYFFIYMVVTILLLVMIVREIGGRSTQRLGKTHHARALYVSLIVLAALFQSSVIGYRYGLDMFRRGIDDESIMTYAERFTIPNDIALVKQYNTSNGRVVDLTRPYRALSTAGLTVLPLAGLSTPEGYNFLFPQWYHQFVAMGVNGIQTTPTRWVQVQPNTRTNFEVLKLLDVRYILAPPGTTIPGYKLLETDMASQKTLHEADITSAFLSPEIHCVANDNEALDILHRGTYQTLVSRAILVSSDPSAGKLCHNGNPAQLNSGGSIPARSVHRGIDTVRVEVESRDGGILTLADTYYPGWQVFVDGKESPLLRTYTALRGVAVGPGQHSVAFVFSPEIFWMLLRLSHSLLAMLAVTGCFVAVIEHWKMRGSMRAVNDV